MLAGCSGISRTLRYGADGQPEDFIGSSGKPMGRCYDTALETCPLGHFLVKETPTPAGTVAGTL